MSWSIIHLYHIKGLLQGLEMNLLRLLLPIISHTWILRCNSRLIPTLDLCHNVPRSKILLMIMEVKATPTQTSVWWTRHRTLESLPSAITLCLTKQWPRCDMVGLIQTASNPVVLLEYSGSALSRVSYQIMMSRWVSWCPSIRSPHRIKWPIIRGM